MEQLKYVSDEYQNRLKNLASLLCPLKEVVTINPLSIPGDEEYDIDYTYYPFQQIVEDTQQGWDSLGDYHCPSLRTEHTR